jgi:hypothetical protein
MTKYSSLLVTLLLTALALGCGSTSNSNRALQSITVTPAGAEAQNFPNGQVQFTATGTFNKAPSPDQLTFQPPYTGGWALMGAGSAAIATISPTGLAQCVPGAAGSAIVVATASANAATGTGATGVAVQGSTTLTCP